MSDWPDDFPESCPPSSAIPATGKFYRLVRDENPSESDFDSNYREKPRRFDGWANKRLCLAMGTSVCRTMEDIEYTRQSIGALKNRRIAVGAINGSGVMMATPARDKPSHHTWWRPIGDDQWKEFSVIA